jgi:hypothetical protein
MTGRDVETYFEDGSWRTRRQDSETPFASGSSRQQMIAAGAEVARWNQVRHIIRDRDGTVAEVNTYGSGPYPFRSPTRHVPDQAE